MCFFKVHYKHRIKSKPIRCYKVLERISDEELLSFKYRFPYKLGETNKPRWYRSVETLDGYDVLHDGVFHSYSNKKNARKYLNNFVRRYYLGDFVMVSCEIPAGTPYWYNNERKEYASTEIKIVEIIN